MVVVVVVVVVPQVCLKVVEWLGWHGMANGEIKVMMMMRDKEQGWVNLAR